MHFDTSKLSEDCADRMRDNCEALLGSMERIGQRVNGADHAILVQAIHDLTVLLEQMPGQKTLRKGDIE